MTLSVLIRAFINVVYTTEALESYFGTLELIIVMLAAGICLAGKDGA